VPEKEKGVYTPSSAGLLRRDASITQVHAIPMALHSAVGGCVICCARSRRECDAVRVHGNSLSSLATVLMTLRDVPERQRLETATFKVRASEIQGVPFGYIP